MYKLRLASANSMTTPSKNVWVKQMFWSKIPQHMLAGVMPSLIVLWTLVCFYWNIWRGQNLAKTRQGCLLLVVVKETYFSKSGWWLWEGGMHCHFPAKPKLCCYRLSCGWIDVLKKILMLMICDFRTCYILDPVSSSREFKCKEWSLLVCKPEHREIQDYWIF